MENTSKRNQSRHSVEYAIYQTDLYSKFEMLPFNRDTGNKKYLRDSMLKHGFISAYPIHVVKNGSNGKLKIKAGHHRFEVAEELGIPIKYVICDDDASVYELEKSTTAWTLKDYTNSFVKLGKKDYYDVLKYHENTGIGLSMCYKLFSGGASYSTHNFISQIREGNFTIKDRHYAFLIADIVKHLKKLGIQWANSPPFVKALSNVLFIDFFNIDRFKTKTQNHIEQLQKQPSQDDYLNAIEDVYNYQQTRDRAPLAFFAKEAAKNRLPKSFRSSIPWIQGDDFINKGKEVKDLFLCELENRIITPDECLDISGCPPKGYDCSNCKYFSGVRNQLLGST